MADEPAKRPKSVPVDAVWDDDGWELGSKDASGKKIGTWTWWREDGVVGGSSEYGDGTTRMTYTRLHPDGEIAQSGAKDLAKDVWVGVMRWMRQAKPSPEDKFYPNMVGPKVRAFEVDLDAGYITTERCYDANGVHVTQTGAATPARPAGVPPGAFLTENDTQWIEQRRFLGDNHLGGERRLWDRNGKLQYRELYREDGTLAEQDKYDDGVLWSTKRVEPNGDFLSSYFHYKSNPRVVKDTTLYRNKQKDRETTYFDKSGVRAFSVRMEEVNPHHVRRYENCIVVHEAIWSSDFTQPPSKVEYYEHDGTKLVTYTPTERGKGVWRLLARDGGVELSLPEDDEHDLNKYGNWDRFVPGFAMYELDREHSDPDAIRERFRDRYGREVAKATLAKMKPSKELAAALGSGSWAKVDSAMGDAKELPVMVKGVLADDPAVAKYALGRIWIEIEHQGSVYEATYRVATALATVFPLLTDRPTIQRRVFDFLRDVLDLHYIGSDAKAFAKLVTAMRGCSAQLDAWADGAEDDALTNDAIRVLARIGGGLARAERLMRESPTAKARAHAACAYTLAAPPKQRKTVLSQAFAQERDRFVRFVLALFLARGDKVTTPEVLAAIEPYLLDPSTIDDEFAELAEFLGDDVGEAIMGSLPDKALASYMETFVADLPAQDILTQVSYLDVIFRIVFPDGVPKKPSALQQKALRACADLVDAHHNFVNHMEVFGGHEIPYDSFVLREAAEGRRAMTTRQARQTMSAASEKPARSIGAAPKNKTKAKKPGAKKPVAKKPVAKKRKTKR